MVLNSSSSLPSLLTVQQLVTALCANTVSESGPQLPIPCNGLVYFIRGLETVNHTTHMRTKTGGSSHQPQSIVWCPAYAAGPDKANKVVSRYTDPTLQEGHMVVNQSTPQADLDSADVLKTNRETLEVL